MAHSGRSGHTRAHPESGRTASAALSELRLHVDTQFDRDVVDALHAAMPSAAALSELQLQELLGRGA